MMKCLLAALIFVAAPAFGMVYSWTDSKGVAHYTNKEYEIPARYRSRVKARFPEATDAAASQSNLQTGTIPPAPISTVRSVMPESQPPVISTESQNNAIKQAARRQKRARRTSEDDE